MTSNNQDIGHKGINYYDPSPSVVDYLQKELQNLEPRPSKESAGGQKYVRKKEGQNTIAKDKKDTFRKIFQSFVDLVYFLEFIESHEELHELFEENLKDLLGINIDELEKDGKRLRRHKVWHWSLFVRFLSAALFNRAKTRKGYDFRTALAYVMVFQALKAMEVRLGHDPDEMTLFVNNTTNIRLWSKLLASRYNEKQVVTRHRLKF